MVLDMQAATIATLESLLNLIAIGLVLVDADDRIIHANRAARSMLTAGAPIRSDRGELRTHRPETTALLRSAIAQAVANNATVGGVGIPASHADGEPALIHVLPLTSNDLPARIAPLAGAALFITPAVDSIGAPPALAAVYDLSAAEMRIFERLIAGETLSRVADQLGIAVTTVKTHLARIFEKTGTSRQADLIRLAAKYCAPISRPKVTASPSKAVRDRTLRSSVGVRRSGECGAGTVAGAPCVES
jgi:DNA-binding CsgD family transcriptional regulator